MAEFEQSSVRNLLLRALSADAFESLQPAMESMDLLVKREVVAADTVTDYVCFVESGLASMVAVSLENEAVEVGHVGYEGMTGAHVMLKVDRTPNRTFMQVEGKGIRVPVEALLLITAQFPVVNDMLLKYVHCCELQLAHSALANGRYNMHERLARWLLMSHDRLEGNDLPLTHEFLSVMLGVRRSGVTNELHIIEGLRAIRATRGNIRIIDRAKLEEIAGGCYGVPEHEYARLIGLPVRRT